MYTAEGLPDSPVAALVDTAQNGPSPDYELYLAYHGGGSATIGTIAVAKAFTGIHRDGQVGNSGGGLTAMLGADQFAGAMDGHYRVVSEGFGNLAGAIWDGRLPADLNLLRRGMEETLGLRGKPSDTPWAVGGSTVSYEELLLPSDQFVGHADMIDRILDTLRLPGGLSGRPRLRPDGTKQIDGGLAPISTEHTALHFAQHLHAKEGTEPKPTYILGVSPRPFAPWSINWAGVMAIGAWVHRHSPPEVNGFAAVVERALEQERAVNHMLTTGQVAISGPDGEPVIAEAQVIFPEKSDGSAGLITGSTRALDLTVAACRTIAERVLQDPDDVPRFRPEQANTSRIASLARRAVLQALSISPGNVRQETKLGELLNTLHAAPTEPYLAPSIA